MTVEPDEQLIDAVAGEVGQADVILVFGTRHWTPSEVAVDLYRRGLAPKIVVTGGATLRTSPQREADLHRSLITARGVPEEDVLCERESSNTWENVAHAIPLLEQTGPVQTVLTVVKWYHRRALVYLAQQVPSVRHIFAADYEPFDRATRRSFSRSNWRQTCPGAIAHESNHFATMQSEGRDLLHRTSAGWVRTSDGG